MVGPAVAQLLTQVGCTIAALLRYVRPRLRNAVADFRPFFPPWRYLFEAVADAIPAHVPRSHVAPLLEQAVGAVLTVIAARLRRSDVT